ncbi:MAG: amino acid ABC transporter permease [Dehalococcoidia bacterium]|nr:amino acid ABC transporter permease [Dehalococcoidia bacterium]
MFRTFIFQNFIDWIDRISFLRKRKTRRISFQLLFLGFLGLIIWYFVSKALQLDLGFSHLNSRAGFGLSHTFFIDYSSNDSRWKAYFTGVINTIRICSLGILLTTILGTIMGVARLSSNFLISRISALYIEILRNTPLLVQIVFWQIVFLKLPQISNAITTGGYTAISNRGILIPWIEANPKFDIFFAIVVIAILISIFLKVFLNRREEEKGQKLYSNFIPLIMFFGISLLGLLFTGIPFNWNIPSVAQNEFGTYMQSGGFELSPEFLALLFALVLYTGTFVTEIVRGSIQSLPKGQTEAALALGFSSYQRIILVILPQALRSIIPPLTNQYLNLTKNSSLAVVIAYPDLFMVTRTIINNSGHALPMFFVVLFTYLSLSLIISLIMNLLNRQVTKVRV